MEDGSSRIRLRHQEMAGRLIMLPNNFSERNYQTCRSWRCIDSKAIRRKTSTSPSCPEPKGDCMADLWDEMSREEKMDAMTDLRAHIKRWRQLTSPYMQVVDGSELRDGCIGTCHGRGCIKTGRNEEEWLENLSPGLFKGLAYEAKWDRGRGAKASQSTLDTWAEETKGKIAKLKADFPRSGPYVLTHGDLHGDNIFISKDNEEKRYKVTAILDWEKAGYYPWWAEKICEKFNQFGDLQEELKKDGQELGCVDKSLFYPELDVPPPDDVM
ncbi:hypothetical protein K402DRAFT_431400 [Aulographum hederae CBS 113979]|uniref:Aminoglycoside phosphotransferase domain-containing protein n=1 Tax=Aulographum hederae CBS 113979 TaxID=1176131 RepID=A0A6G1H088_9PEZI|nr:hypothetical protein K402DRAFT_431400 [Aulographum hederae CBS 113979]